MTAAIHFIGGEKGGVGKSVVARLLAQYHIDRGVPFIGFDTDRSHGSFQRFYGEFASHTVVDDYASLDAIAEAIVEHPQRTVIVDLAAQTMPPLRAWIEDSGLLPTMIDMQVPVRFWHVMDDGVDSLSLLDSLFDAFGQSVAYTVVQNHGRGCDFSNFDSSPIKAKAVAHHATVIELKKLHDASMQKIDRTNASFWSAVNRSGDGALGFLERQRAKVWLSRVYSEFDRIGV